MCLWKMRTDALFGPVCLRTLQTERKTHIHRIQNLCTLCVCVFAICLCLEGCRRRCSLVNAPAEGTTAFWVEAKHGITVHPIWARYFVLAQQYCCSSQMHLLHHVYISRVRPNVRTHTHNSLTHDDLTQLFADAHKTYDIGAYTGESVTNYEQFTYHTSLVCNLFLLAM